MQWKGEFKYLSTLELLETRKDNVYTFRSCILAFQVCPYPLLDVVLVSSSSRYFRCKICVLLHMQVLNYFLSNCLVLERLALRMAPKLVNLRVVGPSIALKHLLIHNCVDLKSIEIRDANIVSFTYRGVDMIDLHLSNVPLLVEVSISKPTFHRHSLSLAFTQLSCCLSQIEILTLDIKGAVSICIYNFLSLFLDFVVPYLCFGFQVYIQNHLFPTLENVKYLELTSSPEHDWDIHHLTCFMKATPYLQRLSLKVYKYCFTWSIM